MHTAAILVISNLEFKKLKSRFKNAFVIKYDTNIITISVITKMPLLTNFLFNILAEKSVIFEVERYEFISS